MAKFSEIREVAIKRTEDDDRHYDVTPRRISAFELGTSRLKTGMDGGEIRWPTYNREKRRETGQIRKPSRIPRKLPPHPLAVIVKAHRIERDGQRDQIARARRELAKERGFKSVRAMMKADKEIQSV